jgi:hypothetical protein
LGSAISALYLFSYLRKMVLRWRGKIEFSRLEGHRITALGNLDEKGIGFAFGGVILP